MAAGYLDPRGMDALLDFDESQDPLLSDAYSSVSEVEQVDDGVQPVRIIGIGDVAPDPPCPIVFGYQYNLDGRAVANVNDQTMGLNDRVAVFAETELQAEKLRRDLTLFRQPERFVIKSRQPLLLIDGFYPTTSEWGAVSNGSTMKKETPNDFNPHPQVGRQPHIPFAFNDNVLWHYSIDPAHLERRQARVSPLINHVS